MNVFQLEPARDSVEDMLTRLEEFQSLIQMVGIKISVKPQNRQVK